MPSTVHLVSGPSLTPRLEQLLQAFRQASAEFDSALFLVPNRRLADQLRCSLGDCLSPLIYDLQAFADELIRVHEPLLRPSCEGDRSLLIDAVLSELGDASLPYFARVDEMRGFTEATAGYIQELKDAGIDVRRLLKAHPGGAGDGSRHYQAALIFERYQRRLARSHRFDPGDRLGRAARLWKQFKGAPFDHVRSVLVAGFATMTEPQQQFLDTICGSIDHLWVEGPETEDEDSAGSPSLGEWMRAKHHSRPARFEQVVVPTMPAHSVHLIEAAGELGEARLVARHIRDALARGIRPDRVLVVSRRFSPEAIALFQEVFDEYEIPHEAEGAETLGRTPAVAFLLRAWRVPTEGWEFAKVASILRSTLFRPSWPEVRDDPELPEKAEALLRMLGETRGRDAFLRAVAAWEVLPPEPLEDEEPEEPLRLRKQRLARRCRPFLELFFNLWERTASIVTPAAAAARVKSFADEIGLSRARPDDLSDLTRFWEELDRWAQRETLDNKRKVLRPDGFARVLFALAEAPCRARSVRGNCVVLASAERAVGLGCDCLCLVSLGETSWPDLAAPHSLLDDAERQRLRQNGLSLPNPDDRLTREQRLFDTLISTPRQELVLSYSAIDDKGQKLPASFFLREYLQQSHVQQSTCQRMLLDGYFARPPTSHVELRTQTAKQGEPASPLPERIIDNLKRARTVARARFECRAYSAFDGELRHPATAHELARRVGRERVFSPTALENYIACPFRFLLQHVLDLEPLEDPREDVEFTRRGSAFHRALARFHGRANSGNSHALEHGDLPDTVTAELVQQVERAVGEYAARAPSRATAELWRLEAKRLVRAAQRYRAHWTSFRKPWVDMNAAPVPHRLEARFGVKGKEGADPLVLTIDNVEIHIGGYIDRVDLVQLAGTVGYWVIDYKTGRATNYQASHVGRLEKLQLPLYALAVERVLLKDRPARPLGLAYWLVTDTGAKPVLPSGRNAALSWINDAEAWPKFARQLENWVGRIVAHIRGGDFPLAPRSETCTETCVFGCVCRIAQSRSTGKVFALELPVVEVGTQTD